MVFSCNFSFYRTLRPYPISSKRIVPDHIDLPDWAIDVSCLTLLYVFCKKIVDMKISHLKVILIMGKKIV